ncbi:uncharacterized protein LOC108112386 [Drosophila eugracilis]|uniref:uncharacterized protein LOC108112386 n=1 Tax=Drosophila eugracilis TaxID=29029 RepID=UPI0007E687FD|nr:uncharacterized protein LOC108112386 [Drosophila eugracilis]
MSFHYSVLSGVLLIYGCGAARKWDYEPISITSTTSDASLMNFATNVARVGRGEFKMSCEVLFNYDTTDETTMEASVFRSPTGDEGDYKLLPWSVPKQPFNDYMNTHYKELIMKNFASCSNIPQFEGDFEPPFPKNTYIGEDCVIKGEGFPDMVPSGFYKVIFNCTGPDQPSWSFVAIFKITAQML